MKKSYQVKIHPLQGATTSVDIIVPTVLASTTVNARSASRLQLIDSTTGLAPDTIRLHRKGKDLYVSFDGRELADLIITDFYSPNSASQNVLVGELQPGLFHLYVPESGDGANYQAQIGDGALPVGMALGGEQILIEQAIEPAAAGGLVALAAFNPLLAAPVLLVGALASGDTKATAIGKAPSILRAELYGADDTGQSNSDSITNKDKPRISGTTEAYANVKITIGGHVYEGQADAQGQFLIPITDTLLGDVQTYQVTVTDASGKTATAAGKPFTLDTSNRSSSQSVGLLVELHPIVSH